MIQLSDDATQDADVPLLPLLACYALSLFPIWNQTCHATWLRFHYNYYLLKQSNSTHRWL
ncbi:hypothetical protein AKJ16_DCAP08929 [Drosera capensis]